MVQRWCIPTFKINDSKKNTKEACTFVFETSIFVSNQSLYLLTCPVCSVSSLLIKYIKKNLKQKDKLDLTEVKTISIKGLNMIFKLIQLAQISADFLF